MLDIGWWEMPKSISGHTDGVTMDTALAALQLQVYYRHLATTKSESLEIAPDADPPDEIMIETSI